MPKIYQLALEIACPVLLVFASIAAAFLPNEFRLLVSGSGSAEFNLELLRKSGVRRPRSHPLITARLNYCLIENLEAGRDLCVVRWVTRTALPCACD